jgi:hypothetical protein
MKCLLESLSNIVNGWQNTGRGKIQSDPPLTLDPEDVRLNSIITTWLPHEMFYSDDSN